MPKVVKTQFTTAGRIHDFDAGELDLKPGDRIIVETERGLSIAITLSEPKLIEGSAAPANLTLVKRKATAEDLAIQKGNADKEKEAYRFCLRRITERGMQMKLVSVEYLFDGSKAIFFFTADGRVDFRELVKDLAHTFHTRIEMRQIGVRDESKMIGGIGICGRELCCSSFLREFQPVSVKMAKEQNLALNPTKISGQCGRLLCCLDYEYETYCSLRKEFPKCGKRACTATQCGIVDKINILTGDITLKLDDNKLALVKRQDLVPDDGRSEPVPAPVAASAKKPERAPRRSAPPQPVPEKPIQPVEESKPAGADPAEDAPVQQAGEQKKGRKRNRFRKHGQRRTQGAAPAGDGSES